MKQSLRNFKCPKILIQGVLGCVGLYCLCLMIVMGIFGFGKIVAINPDGWNRDREAFISGKSDNFVGFDVGPVRVK